MNEARPRQADPAHPDQAADDLFDWRKLSRYLSFALGSVKRRPLLFAGVLANVVAMAAVAMHVLPPTYQVETRLLAQKNPALAVRGDQSASDSPTVAAAEIIVRHDNLRQLIHQTDLVREWRVRRAPLGRLKDAVMSALGRVATDAELEDALVGLLDKRLLVWSSTQEGTVTIKVLWTDGEMAYRLVDAAQRNFLETRHLLEVSTIAEQISILELHAAELKKQVDEQVAKVEQLREQRLPRRRGSTVRRPLPLAPPLPESELQQQATYEAKRRAIGVMEEARSRALLEAQTKMSELRAVYAENHPNVVDQEQKIRSLSAESPQLTHMRQEVEEMRKVLGARAETASERGRSSVAQELIQIPPDPDDDSATEYARARLRYLLQQDASLREKIDAARIDFDTSRAAFKYRYVVVLPPERPRGAIKPKKPLVYTAAFFAGMIAAVLSTTLTDLRRGRVVAGWQLEEITGRKVIEVRRS